MLREGPPPEVDEAIASGKHGSEAAIGPGMAKLADGLALATADPEVEGPLPFEHGYVVWGAAAKAQQDSRAKVRPGRPVE